MRSDARLRRRNMKANGHILVVALAGMALVGIMPSQGQEVDHTASGSPGGATSPAISGSTGGHRVPHVAGVKALAKAGVSDGLIISQIRITHTVYHLSTAEIIDLKNSGVSEKVID